MCCSVVEEEQLNGSIVRVRVDVLREAECTSKVFVRMLS